MNKLVFSILTILALQNCSVFAHEQDCNKSIKTFFKKYGPGALKVAAGLIWFKQVNQVMKDVHIDITYTNLQLDLIAYKACTQIKLTEKKFGADLDPHVHLERTVALQPTTSTLLSRVPILAQFTLVTSGLYDLYQAYKQG